MILCGAMSTDLMQGQVGPVIAGLLERPCLTAVHTLDHSRRPAGLRCDREVEGGRHEMFELELPAVVTVQSGIHAPRYPALSKLLRANHYPLERLPAEALKRMPERQQVVAVKKPEKSRAGVILAGSALEKARRLTTLFHERGRLGWR